MYQAGGKKEIHGALGRGLVVPIIGMILVLALLVFSDYFDPLLMIAMLFIILLAAIFLSFRMLRRPR